jgi:hypothetical protein
MHILLFFFVSYALASVNTRLAQIFGELEEMLAADPPPVTRISVTLDEREDEVVRRLRAVKSVDVRYNPHRRHYVISPSEEYLCEGVIVGLDAAFKRQQEESMTPLNYVNNHILAQCPDAVNVVLATGRYEVTRSPDVLNQRLKRLGVQFDACTGVVLPQDSGVSIDGPSLYSHYIVTPLTRDTCPAAGTTD